MVKPRVPVESLTSDEVLSDDDYKPFWSAASIVLCGKNIQIVRVTDGDTDDHVWMAVQRVQNGDLFVYSAVPRTTTNVTECLSWLKSEIERQFQKDYPNWQPNWNRTQFPIREVVRSNNKDRFVYAVAFALCIAMNQAPDAFKVGLGSNGNTLKIRKIVAAILKKLKLPTLLSWQPIRLSWKKPVPQ